MISSADIILRLVASTVLGALVGLEREIHGGAAGLRTHILVSLGATLIMITSVNIAGISGNLGPVDPSRIASNVVTGVGFLGAGAIIRYGTSIRGLTTAASIWAVAAIGLAVGAGMYTAATATTIIAVMVLVLSKLEERMALKHHGKKLCIILSPGSSTSTNDIDNIIQAYGGIIKRVSEKEREDSREKILVMDLLLSRMYHKDLVVEISSLPGVSEVKWARS